MHLWFAKESKETRPEMLKQSGPYLEEFRTIKKEIVASSGEIFEDAHYLGKLVTLH